MATLYRIYFNAVYGGLGGLLAWLIYGIGGRPASSEGERLEETILSGVIIGGIIGYFVVSVEAILDRSPVRFSRLASYGLVLGAIGGAVGMLVGDYVNYWLSHWLSGVFFEMLKRGLGWLVLGMAIGMSEGIAARSLGKFSYGTLGGALGGLVGGGLFGLFYSLAIQHLGTTYWWGAVGLVITGACIGSLSALVQAVFQPACVKVLRGWQEGREYPLDKIRTLLGRDEHADIALFRDMKIEKRHAYIERLGSQRFVLINNGAPPEYTRVNEQPVADRQELQDGDRIQLGQVVLRFHLRAAAVRWRSARRLPVPAGGPS